MLNRLLKIISRKPKMPDASWLEAADREVDFTPDLWKLEQYEWQLLFTYDETQWAHREYRIIKEDSFNCCDAFTVKTHELWQKNLGAKTFPIAIEAENRPPWRATHQKIRGEVHALRPHVFKVLDKYKLNGLEFERKRVRVLVPNKMKLWTQDGGTELKNSVKLIQAWMYVGIPSYWDDQIAHSPIETYSAVETFEGDKPYIAKYSYFTNK